MEHASVFVVEPAGWPGVRLTLRRMSLGRRIELARQVRELAGRLEFHAAGDSFTDRVEAAFLSGEVGRVLLRWGVAAVDGLEIDGVAATPELLIEAGPEGLCQTVLEAIRRECGLSDEERKN